MNFIIQIIILNLLLNSLGWLKNFVYKQTVSEKRGGLRRSCVEKGTFLNEQRKN